MRRKEQNTRELADWWKNTELKQYLVQTKEALRLSREDNREQNRKKNIRKQPEKGQEKLSKDRYKR